MDPENVLVIGGAGFIGSNIASHYLKQGKNVTVLDNLSRKGSEKNLQWLKTQGRMDFVNADISKDQDKINRAVSSADVVFHLAAQVAVTTSVENPRQDFEINLLGTFNLLEAIRNSKNKPPIIYSSTNKVYGGMEDIQIIEKGNRYEYKDLHNGIPVTRGLDFHSPYGCSKGGADQYVRDYSRIYGIKTVVFRKSCIYGYRQFGVEDQGWVAWFAIASLLDKPLTIFGDGKQVRDVLFIDDLVRAYELAIKNINKTSGQIYNLGGGPKNTLSLLELIDMLERIYKKKIPYKTADWRPGDQKVCIMDVRKAREFSWEPTTPAKEGVEKLAGWVKENRKLFTEY